MCYVLAKQDLILASPIISSKQKGISFPPLRRDRNPKGGGKIVFVREGFIAKQMKNFETKNSETICLDLTIVKKMVHTFCLPSPKH